MNFIIDNYMSNLTKEELANFAYKNGVNLTLDELNFTYDFVKKNYQKVLKNPSSFDFSLYKDKFSKESYNKIYNLLIFYHDKYASILKYY